MILFIIGIVFALLYWKVIKPHKFWANQGVPQRKQFPLFGDSSTLVFYRQSMAEMAEDIYHSFPRRRTVGMYQMLEPMLMIRDPELIRQITIKDFDHFMDHRKIVNVEEPLWNRNLLNLSGAQWKEMRSTLSPTFTSSKMKQMYQIMDGCADKFSDNFTKKSEGEVLEMKDFFTRFANDVIATCAFGIDVDSWKEKDNEFYRMGKQATNFLGFWANIRLMMLSTFPTLSKMIGLRMFNKKVSNFFHSVVMNTIKVREEKGIVRPDVINLLMEARKGVKKLDDTDTVDTGFATVQEVQMDNSQTQTKTVITDMDVTAQALIFFFAGFDSIAGVLCFLTYELAVNPDIQERLREEVDETLVECKGKLTYDALMKMKYLDMVVSETLRKWPNAVMTDRKCVKAYTIQPEGPNEAPIHISPGTSVWLPIYSIQRDPKYYPNPDSFDPERFSEDNKGNIKPYTYLPFGAGPRNCIGSRFALLEAKTICFYLISKLEFIPCSKTLIPMKLLKASFNLAAEGGFYLKLKPRSR